MTREQLRAQILEAILVHCTHVQAEPMADEIMALIRLTLAPGRLARHRRRPSPIWVVVQALAVFIIGFVCGALLAAWQGPPA